MPRRFPSLSLPSLIFLTWAMIAAFGFGHRFLNSDGDLARHLRHGATILAQGGVIRQDPFSFTRPGAPFVGFEYGSQVALATAERLAGLAGVVALAATLVGAALLLLMRFLLRRGMEPGAAYLGTSFAGLLTATHWVARPHLFSFVFIVLLLELIDRDDDPTRGGIFLLFAVWANVHGGWLYGLLLVAAYGAGRIIDAHRRRRAGSTAARFWLSLLVTAGLATCLTPYGWQVPAHVFGFLFQRFIQEHTDEFVSPSYRDVGSQLFLLTLLGTLAAFALVARRPRTDRLIGIMLAVALALVGRRNIAMFALVGLPLVLLHVDPELRRLPEPPNFRRSFAEAADRREWTWTLAAAVVLWVAALASARGVVRLLPTTFDARIFPVSAVARTRGDSTPPSRLFSDFQWSGYVLWAWPGQKVFIDGGTDFFGEEVLRDYLLAETASPGWSEVLDRYGVDATLLTRASPLASALSNSARWRESYGDSVAVMFRRLP